MKFTLTKNIRKDTLLKPLLSGLLLFTLLFVIIDYLNSSALLGNSYTTLYSTLHGNEEEFIEPLLPSTLLESVHMNTFFLMMISITLCAVAGRLITNSFYSQIIVHVIMLSALLELSALLGAYYLSAVFIVFYLIGFYVWHLTTLCLTFICLRLLYKQS